MLEITENEDVIADSRQKNEDMYKDINPTLARLREQEREKIAGGMDPKQAQRERRNAVKAYYNKKLSEERT